ncbi:MAG TPA: hypothetical protein VN773_05155 [Verrucomicrobiae bacterium]|nr:hypothetical protein [Verrucomicrobiae bacterium]
MGPLLLTGLVTGGAAIAIGMVAASSTRPVGTIQPITPVRRLALILTAFITGTGLWSVVIGVLAVILGAIDAPGTAPIIAPVIALAGAVVALALVARNLANVDPWVASRAGTFILGLGVLAVVVAILAIVIRERGHVVESGPFAILGIVMAGSVLGLGVSGAASIRAVGELDGAAALAMTSKAIARCLPFQAVAVGATVVAIVLLIRT